MYNYFDSKEALLKEVILGGFNDLIEKFDPNHDGIITDEEFENFINELFVIIDNSIEYWKLYFSVFTQPQVVDFIRPKYNELFEKMMTPLMRFFERKNYDEPETEALIFGSILDGLTFNYVYNPEPFQVKKIKNRILEMYL